MASITEIEKPSWFDVPNNGMGYTFADTGKPKDFTLPGGKYAIWNGATKEQDICGNSGTSIFNRCGFTHIDFNSDPLNKVNDVSKRHRFFGDNAWISGSPGASYINNTALSTILSEWGWFNLINAVSPIDPITNLRLPPLYDVVMVDWEAVDGTGAIFTSNGWDKVKEMIYQFHINCPGVKLHFWSIAPTYGAIYGDFSEIVNGAETGVRSLQGCMDWYQQRYLGATATNYFNDPDPLRRLDIGSVFGYRNGDGEINRLYSIIHMIESSGIASPDVPVLASMWIDTETVGGFPHGSIDYKIPGHPDHLGTQKASVTPDLYYSTWLYCLLFKYGVQEWDTYAINEDINAIANDYHSNYVGIWKFPDDPDINGDPGEPFIPVYYLSRYIGWYNYAHLAMWIASENKPIIEANTPTIMPEYNAGNGWRTGAETYTSFAYFRKEPICRLKYNQAGTEALLYVCNPFNNTPNGLQTVQVRDGAWQFTITLETGFPQVYKISI